MSEVAAIARTDLRMLRRDPVYAVTFIVMPLLTMAVTKGMSRAALVDAGHVAANGAEQAVLGGIVFFAFFLVGHVSFGVFREHAWGTWSRLRASPARPGQILAGKVVVPILTLVVQLVVLLVLGSLLFDLDLRAGALVPIVLVVAAYGVVLVAIGLALLAVCRTRMQVDAVTNLAAFAMGAVGGALAPLESLPGWARAVAPATPSYWAMRGLRAVTLESGGTLAVLPSVAVLLGIAAVLFTVARLRFRVDERKVGYA